VRILEEKIKKLDAEIWNRENPRSPLLLLTLRVEMLETKVNKIETKVDDFATKLPYAVLILARLVALVKLI